MYHHAVLNASSIIIVTEPAKCLIGNEDTSKYAKNWSKRKIAKNNATTNPPKISIVAIIILFLEVCHHNVAQLRHIICIVFNIPTYTVFSHVYMDTYIFIRTLL